MKKDNKPGFLTVAIDRFFRDKNGRVVIWQAPNLLIYGWVLFKIFSLAAAQPSLKDGFGQVGNALLFVWAYLELTQGVTYFRRTLGLVVVGLLVFNFFQN